MTGTPGQASCASVKPASISALVRLTVAKTDGGEVKAGIAQGVNQIGCFSAQKASIFSIGAKS
ncbi:hypothetical protein SDC9_210143 [bioreactor metagenome]|uniref:Uncharacterized protein n=1 Tax=bioreactor metagenome TaxID=1076179 RepID=A0A645JG13_9ZZZZ